MDEKASFICRLLGYLKMDGWVKVYKKEDMEKLEKYKNSFDLGIKLWITET